jgi:aldehyde dehydrogenase (NAD+)
MAPLTVPKTYKLFIGGAFPRSESGRTYPLRDGDGRLLANAALASRKDLRDAVVAARKGFGAWSRATPYNRGQIIYRIAEMLDARSSQFADLLVEDWRATTATRRTDAAQLSNLPEHQVAQDEVAAAVERVVHYAGWTDKLAAVFGGTNPVSSPYFCYSVPEPVGVVGVIAPLGLLGLVSVIGPVIAGGNACVVIAAEADARLAITLAEVVATSDVPAGVLNVLTGRAAELAPHLASHADVNALDLTGVAADSGTDLERAAADTIKRVYVPRGTPDFTAAPGTARLRAFLEIKTVWHPTGALSLAGGGGY